MGNQASFQACHGGKILCHGHREGRRWSREKGCQPPGVSHAAGPLGLRPIAEGAGDKFQSETGSRERTLEAGLGLIGKHEVPGNRVRRSCEVDMAASSSAMMHPADHCRTLPLVVNPKKNTKLLFFLKEESHHVDGRAVKSVAKNHFWSTIPPFLKNRAKLVLGQ